MEFIGHQGAIIFMCANDKTKKLVMKMVSTPQNNYNWWYHMYLERERKEKMKNSLVIAPEEDYDKG